MPNGFCELYQRPSKQENTKSEPNSEARNRAQGLSTYASATAEAACSVTHERTRRKSVPALWRGGEGGGRWEVVCTIEAFAGSLLLVVILRFEVRPIDLTLLLVLVLVLQKVRPPTGLLLLQQNLHLTAFGSERGGLSATPQPTYRNQPRLREQDLTQRTLASTSPPRSRSKANCFLS